MFLCIFFLHEHTVHIQTAHTRLHAYTIPPQCPILPQASSSARTTPTGSGTSGAAPKHRCCSPRQPAGPEAPHLRPDRHSNCHPARHMTSTPLTPAATQPVTGIRIEGHAVWVVGGWAGVSTPPSPPLPLAEQNPGWVRAWVGGCAHPGGWGVCTPPNSQVNSQHRSPWCQTTTFVGSETFCTARIDILFDKLRWMVVDVC